MVLYNLGKYQEDLDALPSGGAVTLGLKIGWVVSKTIIRDSQPLPTYARKHIAILKDDEGWRELKAVKGKSWRKAKVELNLWLARLRLSNDDSGTDIDQRSCTVLYKEGFT